MLFDIDEHVRADATLEQLAQDEAGVQEGRHASPPATPRASTTAPPRVVMASGDAVEAASLKPLARLVGYAHAGVEPELHGPGPGAGHAPGARSAPA